MATKSAPMGDQRFNQMKVRVVKILRLVYDLPEKEKKSLFVFDNTRSFAFQHH